MANYVVTIRTKDGSLAERDYTANDRAELFQKLAADGVTAVRVSEGAAGKKPRKAVKKAGSPSKGRGLVAAIAAILIAGVAAWFMWPEEKKVVEAKETSGRKKIENREAPRKHVNVTNVQEKVEKEKKGEKKQDLPKFGKLPDGRWMVPGRKKIHNVVTNFSNVSREVPFRNATEQIMFQIFSRERGDMPLPLPLISERERKNLAAILMSKNPISDKDSEEMRLSKEVIEEAKSALKDYIKQGGDIDTFFTYYHNELQRSYETRKEAVRMVFEAARGEDRDIAVQLCEKVNEKLAAEGIKPVKLPRILLEKH